MLLFRVAEPGLSPGLAKAHTPTTPLNMTCTFSLIFTFLLSSLALNCPMTGILVTDLSHTYTCRGSWSKNMPEARHNIGLELSAKWAPTELPFEVRWWKTLYEGSGDPERMRLPHLGVPSCRTWVGTWAWEAEGADSLHLQDAISCFSSCYWYHCFDL